MSVLLGNGNGTLQARQPFTASPMPFAVALVEYNGDSKLDLATINGDAPGGVSTLLGNGNGTFQAKQDFGTDPWAFVGHHGRFQRRRGKRPHDHEW